jgi:hypothetical protein
MHSSAAVPPRVRATLRRCSRAHACVFCARNFVRNCARGRARACVRVCLRLCVRVIRAHIGPSRCAGRRRSTSCAARRSSARKASVSTRTHTRARAHTAMRARGCAACGRRAPGATSTPRAAAPGDALGRWHARHFRPAAHVRDGARCFLVGVLRSACSGRRSPSQYDYPRAWARPVLRR